MHYTTVILAFCFATFSAATPVALNVNNVASIQAREPLLHSKDAVVEEGIVGRLKPRTAGCKTSGRQFWPQCFYVVQCLFAGRWSWRRALYVGIQARQ
ncbi:hypothetical protein BKA63DRAFT_512548 [Paraphoma chrysanthemicola]|nr:hypothetical protein BKA63DRAFT_512548 [Paraphoma chrysanthemicola]